MFLGLPDPDPLVKGTDPDPPNQSKIVVKPLISTVLYDFLSVKNDVNVLSKSNEQQNFFVSIFKVTQDPDPDPYQNFTDPKQCSCSTLIMINGKHLCGRDCGTEMKMRKSWL
jgi:hypothetical protein